ncbi:peptidase inhibitor family I36 protein [Streptomyces mutabilis]|uniref:peptidase inhibitor family I36 protein n=1 Tax=Streptomyces mutabilis TaxID=67332 RepID=UPI0036A55519
MRKTLAAAATLGLATLGVLVPASGAQASAACDNAWHSAASGYFYAYDHDNCSGQLGRDVDDDAHWADSSGAFQGGDNDDAQSLLHKGTSGMAVKVYQHANYGGGHACLAKSEYYMSDLSAQKFSNGAWVNQSISSHKWVWHADCGKFLDS